MMRLRRFLPTVIALSTALTPAHSRDTPTPGGNHAARPAAGLELWSSTDSDNTDVVKILGRALWKFEGRDSFQGIAIERAWFRPQGQRARKQDRIYLEVADDVAGKWLWRTRFGTNGDTVIGSATVRASDWSKEFFIEREIVETPRGIDEGIYYTFVGANLDLRESERDIFSAMLGVQEFTGRNERLHARGSYVRVIRPEIGLSAQLRGRYFHSTSPGEFDYFSPSDFVQLLPVVQMRRFDGHGWMYLAALGYGVQKATGSPWQAARLAEVRIESPASSKTLQAFGQLQYTNNSLSGAGDYHYVMARAGLTAGFR